MKRELYICIRFSRKAQGQAGEQGLELLRKGLEKNVVPRIKQEMMKADKKVKVWTKLV